METGAGEKKAQENFLSDRSEPIQRTHTVRHAPSQMFANLILDRNQVHKEQQIRLKMFKMRVFSPRSGSTAVREIQLAECMVV